MSSPDADAPAPTLTPEEAAAGVLLADPRWGYKYTQEGSGLVQPFDFVLGAVGELRQKLEPKPHDVFIATYPKCGTTWMQQIVMLLLRGSSERVDPMKDAPWLEMAVSRAASGVAPPSGTPSLDCAALAALGPPEGDGGRRVWKSHAPASAVPWRGGPAAAAAAGARAIIVCRNTKDAAVSMLHHTRNIPGFGFHGGWDEFVPLFLEGRVESSSIWEWHRGWWEAATASPQCVLVVHFEDLKANLAAEVGRVAAHLGLERSAAELAAVAARCTFEAMKAEAAERDAATVKAGGVVKKEHFRQGKTGGWRELMSPAQLAAFDAKEAELQAAVGETGHGFRPV